jgi:hypothetical protein
LNQLATNEPKYFFLNISMLWEAAENNKLLGTCELNRFFSVESAYLKSQVDPTISNAGKIIQLHSYLPDGAPNVY